MKRIIINYFSSLFTSSRPNITSETVNMIDQRVTAEIQYGLDSTFTQDEVSLALKYMKTCKSPGSYGLPALFYKRYWPIFGEDISSLVLNVLNGS